MTAFVDLLAEIVLGGLLQLLQDHRGDLGRRVLLAAGLDDATSPFAAATTLYGTIFISSVTSSAPAHEALDREDGVLGIGYGLALGDLADEPLAALGKCHDRRRGAAALALVMTTGSPPSMTATTELVVPRSMPIILLMDVAPRSCWWLAERSGRPEGYVTLD